MFVMNEGLGGVLDGETGNDARSMEMEMDQQMLKDDNMVVPVLQGDLEMPSVASSLKSRVDSITTLSQTSREIEVANVIPVLMVASCMSTLLTLFPTTLILVLSYELLPCKLFEHQLRKHGD